MKEFKDRFIIGIDHGYGNIKNYSQTAVPLSEPTADGAASSGTKTSTASANARAFPVPRKRKSTRK